MNELGALTLALKVEKAEFGFYIKMIKRAKDERAKRCSFFDWRRSRTLGLWEGVCREAPPKNQKCRNSIKSFWKSLLQNTGRIQRD